MCWVKLQVSIISLISVPLIDTVRSQGQPPHFPQQEHCEIVHFSSENLQLWKSNRMPANANPDCVRRETSPKVRIRRPIHFGIIFRESISDGHCFTKQRLCKKPEGSLGGRWEVATEAAAYCRGPGCLISSLGLSTSPLHAGSAILTSLAL